MNVDDRTPANDCGPIAFASYQLDRRGGRLMRGSEPIPVRRKTWEVLLYLVERPGVLVTKEDLLDAVWPETSVTPDVLIRSIRELRLALGDDSKTPRCIETVHRRGYRFIAKISDQSPMNSNQLPVTSDRRAASASALTTGHWSLVTNFVGRDEEIRRLEKLFAKVRAGERQMIFVTGPVGVGKTTLAEAFLDSPAVRAAAGPVWIGRGCCIEQHGAREAYMPVLEALEHVAHRPDAKRLRSLLRRAAPTWLVQMPWLLGNRAAAMRSSLQAAKPERMLREFSSVVEALTADVTLVLVLEDLHWSDAATVDLLVALAQRRGPARLLVIGTYRPADAAVHHHALSRALRALQARRQCVELAVHELTRNDVEKYLEARFPGAEFAAALAPLLHDYTDGTPLFVVAVVEHMLSRGWILETKPGWALSAPVEKLPLEVPDDARRLIELQLDDLSPADRSLLEAASVMGTEFAVQPLAAALNCRAEDVEIRCEALARTQRFLHIAGTAEWPDGSVARRYAFTHELYRQAAYTEIPDGQRQRLHQRIGEALEAAYKDRATAIAPELAVHFERSRDRARTLLYLAAAAARARQRFASREAAGYLETAITLAARLPDARERQCRELELRLALGPILSDLHGFASQPVCDNTERTYELCTEVGSREQLFQVLYALCHLHAARADKALLPDTQARLNDLARRLGTAEHRLLADTVLIRVAIESGRFTEGCRLAEECLPPLQEAEATCAPFTYGAEPVIVSTAHYAIGLWMLGQTERARATMDAVVAAGKRSGSAFTRAAVLAQVCVLESLRRNTARLHELADQVIGFSAEHGFAFWHAMASALRGWARVQSGQLRDGIEEIERARAELAATGAVLFSTYILAFLAEAQLRAGAFDAGLAAIDAALAVADSSLDRSYCPELWRLKGELLLKHVGSGQSRVERSRRHAAPQTVSARRSTLNFKEAERCLRRALELSRAGQAKSLELRAATSLARAWHVQGRTADGRALLADLCEWFGPSAQSPDLTEARALLGQPSMAAPDRGRATAVPRRAAHSRQQSLPGESRWTRDSRTR